MTQRNRSRRCPVCTLTHTPLCPPPPAAWPARALIDAAAGTRRMAEALGWRAPSGGLADRLLDDITADRWAVACGLHPELVWPGWCDAGLTVGDRQAVESGGWRPAWEWAEAQRSTATRGTAA